MLKYLIYPLRMWWSRTVDSFRDPVRRWQVLTQFLLAFGLGFTWTGSALRGVGLMLTYFVTYEFILEPYSRWMVNRKIAGKWYIPFPKVGPYFERGPRDHERFIYE